MGIVYEDGSIFIHGPVVSGNGRTCAHLIRTIGQGFGIEWLPNLDKRHLHFVHKFTTTRATNEEASFGYVNIPDGTWYELKRLALTELDRERIRRIIANECEVIVFSETQIMVRRGPFQIFYEIVGGQRLDRTQTRDLRRRAKSLSIPRETRDAFETMATNYLLKNMGCFTPKQPDLFGTALPFAVRKAKTR